MDAVKNDILEIRKELYELKSSINSGQSVEQIVKYLLYFWLTISVVLGIFGWKQLSDLDNQIKRAVSAQFPEDSNNYKNYKTLIGETKKLHDDFTDLTAEYKERVDALKYADVIASDFDLEGQVHAIVLESNIPGVALDNEWRAKAISILKKFKRALSEKAFPATFVFNAAQVCRQLQQFELTEEMTNAAYEKDKSPPIRALKLASEISNKTGSDRDAAYLEIVRMVENLDYQSSPQIVLAEAWNAAETIRNYQPLIDAVDKLVASKESTQVPSYAYLIKAQSALRLGSETAKHEALLALEEGYSVFQKESPHSQWNESFEREYPNLVELANQKREIDIGSSDTSMNEQDVLNQMKMLQQLFGPDQPTLQEDSTNKKIQPTQ